MQDLQQTFPLTPRAVQEEGSDIVLSFTGQNQTCIDFMSRPDSGTARARHC
jgi:hypothetical protein